MGKRILAWLLVSVLVLTGADASVFAAEKNEPKMVIESAHDLLPEENAQEELSSEFQNTEGGEAETDTAVKPEEKEPEIFVDQDNDQDLDDIKETIECLEVKAASNDNEPPILKSVSIDKKEVTVGDTVTITAEAEDESGIDYISVQFKNGGVVTSTAWMEKQEDGTYKATITIVESFLNGQYKCSWLSLVDKVGNRLLMTSYDGLEFNVNISEEYSKINNLDGVNVFTSNTSLYSETINGDVYIGPDAILSLSNVEVNGNIYVLGGLRIYTGTAYAIYSNSIIMGTNSTIYQGQAQLAGTINVSSLIASNNVIPKMPVHIESDLSYVENGKIHVAGATLDIADFYINDQLVNTSNGGKFIADGIEAGNSSIITFKWVTVFGTITKDYIYDDNGKISEVPTCMVKFDLLGHGLDGWSQNDVEYKMNSLIQSPSEPNETGYTFGGWFVDEECTKPWLFETDKVMSDTTLYAKWDIIKYAITYNLDGGTNNASNPAEYDMFSDKITFQDPTKEGFKFAGWYTDSKFENEVKAIEKGMCDNVSLYAKWIPNKYTIYFDGNGATQGKMGELKPCEYGVEYSLPDNKYIKRGCVFVGWNTKKDSSGIGFVNGETIKSLIADDGGSITLYAQWRTGGYYIFYNLDGGKNDLSNPTGYDANTGTIYLKNPEKEGYKFSGWYSDPFFKKKSTQMSCVKLSFPPTAALPQIKFDISHILSVLTCCDLRHVFFCPIDHSLRFPYSQFCNPK